MLMYQSYVQFKVTFKFMLKQIFKNDMMNTINKNKTQLKLVFLDRKPKPKTVFKLLAPYNLILDNCTFI